MQPFYSVKEFFLNHEMSLDLVGSLCTDGAPAMLGNKSGFASLVKKEIPHIAVTLHRHALVAMSLPEKRKNLLSIAVSAVNYIRGNALNHRLFKVFCNEIGAKRSVLLYHTEVKWLSRGRVLTRVFNCAKKSRCFSDSGVAV